jgi:hypothetical protein
VTRVTIHRERKCSESGKVWSRVMCSRLVKFGVTLGDPNGMSSGHSILQLKEKSEPEI